MICGAKNEMRSKLNLTPIEEAQKLNRMEMYQKLLFFRGNINNKLL